MKPTEAIEYQGPDLKEIEQAIEYLENDV